MYSSSLVHRAWNSSIPNVFVDAILWRTFRIQPLRRPRMHRLFQVVWIRLNAETTSLNMNTGETQEGVFPDGPEHVRFPRHMLKSFQAGTCCGDARCRGHVANGELAPAIRWRPITSIGRSRHSAPCKDNGGGLFQEHSAARSSLECNVRFIGTVY